MHVAIVDPSRTVRKLLTQLLEARGHVVHACADGREVLARVRSQMRVDALITSATLPSMSAVELCWEMRLMAGAGHPIYLIVMSSSSERRLRIEALDSGADEFIDKPFSAEELYARLRVAERLGSMHRELIELATIDALTGVLNRRAFFERATEICEAADGGMSLSAIMMDIDHFKRINDAHGHDVGDIAIRAVAQAAAEEAEIVGRLGGEEFAILLVGQAIGEAVATAERLRSRLEALELDGADASVRVTCSLGVSEWRSGDVIDRLLKRADVALYAAKSGGRNRVVVASSQTDASDEHRSSSVIRRAPRPPHALPAVGPSGATPTLESHSLC